MEMDVKFINMFLTEKDDDEEKIFGSDIRRKLLISFGVSSPDTRKISFDDTINQISHVLFDFSFVLFL